MRQPPRPGSAQRSIWEGATICLGWCGLSVPALADQPFARICMANNFASISDLNVRVEGHIPDIGLCHCCITPGANESFVRQCGSFGSLRKAANPNHEFLQI